MLGSFGHPTFNNVQQCPTMLAFVGINVGIVWPGLYLCKRMQFCRVNGVSSELNDLPFSLQNSQVTMYADDTTLSHSSKNIVDLSESFL